MTAIVGIVENGKVWMGGDAAGCAGYSLSIRSDTKVFINGGAVFGFTSSFRMGQLLQYDLTMPNFIEGETLDEYMVRRFIPAVRSLLKSGGYSRSHDGQDKGGFFLVGLRGALFTIESDYQVAKHSLGYNAVGCGEDLCLGSLHTTQPWDLTPEQRITMALDAASTHSAGVVGPYTILSI